VAYKNKKHEVRGDYNLTPQNEKCMTNFVPKILMEDIDEKANINIYL
jgi:hypothetical protein